MRVEQRTGTCMPGVPLALQQRDLQRAARRGHGMHRSMRSGLPGGQVQGLRHSNSGTATMRPSPLQALIKLICTHMAQAERTHGIVTASNSNRRPTLTNGTQVAKWRQVCANWRVMRVFRILRCGASWRAGGRQGEPGELGRRAGAGQQRRGCTFWQPAGSLAQSCPGSQPSRPCLVDGIHRPAVTLRVVQEDGLVDVATAWA